MSFYALRLLLVGLALVLGTATIGRAGMTADTPYTIHGQADFDTALQLLNPYGTWSKIGGKWAYTPRDHETPYTNGRWLYTEYGWYWKGNLPHSWATEHYGYWKRGADKVWSWYPGPVWVPQIVEMRATATYIGWRCGEVDDSGNFVEAPIDRYSKPEEWTFVTLAQFANPITPDTIAKRDVAEAQLDDSTDCNHAYFTYREIDRPGPHPADLTKYPSDGGMLSPNIYHNETDPSLSLAETPTPPPAPPTPTPSKTLATATNQAPATNAPAAHVTGTNAPALVNGDVDPNVDLRRVNYWVTMSLPSYWSKPPPDAKAGNIYIYRPDFYQDQDGIARRITLWFNPKARTSLAEVLGQNAPPLTTTTPAASASGPDTPAVPASNYNPFHSPLDDRFQGDTTPHPANNSSKTAAPLNSAPNGPVPAGLAPTTSAVPNGVAPATNAAPGH